METKPDEIYDGSSDRRVLRRRYSDTATTQRLEERMSAIEDGYLEVSKTMVKLETIVENSSHLMNRFENVLENMNKTLRDLNVTIVEINSATKANSQDIITIDGNLSLVKKDIKSIEDKGKIDFLDLIKNNFAKFVFGGGLLGGLAFWIDHILDTLLK